MWIRSTGGPCLFRTSLEPDTAQSRDVPTCDVIRKGYHTSESIGSLAEVKFTFLEAMKMICVGAQPLA